MFLGIDMHSASSNLRPDESTLRRARECCNQLHSSLLKWRDARNSCVKAASEFVNMKIASGSGSVVATSELARCLRTLDEVHSTVSSLSGNMQAMHRLVCKRAKQCPELAEVPLFHTLSVARFVSLFETILAAYSQQLSLCHSATAQLETAKDRDTMLTYVSMLKHEPYIDESVRLAVETLLKETDLR